MFFKGHSLTSIVTFAGRCTSVLTEFDASLPPFTSVLIEGGSTLEMVGSRLGGRRGCCLKTETGKDSPLGPRRTRLVAKSKSRGL